MFEAICFNTDDDALLESGWPRGVRSVDGPPDDRRAAIALRAYNRSARAYGSEWPREVAYRLLRDTEEPPTKSETRDILVSVLATPDPLAARRVVDTIFIAETI